MTRRSRANRDPIEQKIELALDPGAFIPYRGSFSFVGDLEQVAAKIAHLATSEPSRAVRLYETFLAASYAKADEIDDSSGSFGQFVEELYCGWIMARQAEGADPDETACRLLGWIENDDYGFCYRLEKEAVKILDKANLAALIRQVRSRFDTAAKASPKTDGTLKDRSETVRRICGGTLRILYAAQKDVGAYIALAEETGLTAQDCHTIATLLVGRRKPVEAIAWVDRGVGLDKKTSHGSIAGHDLVKLKRELLSKLGCGNDALQDAWAEYREHPSRYTYDDLMQFVPKAERVDWHEKAMDAAKGADLYCAMDLYLATKELNRLADLVSRAKDEALEELSHYLTGPVAKKFEKTHPGLAARLWRAQGMRIANAKKSKYYAAALRNFERSKRCFERAGLDAEWQRTVGLVRTDHYRKIGFMSGFERVVSGIRCDEKPAFLEKAKARWDGRWRRV